MRGAIVKKKDCEILISVLAKQSAECAQLSDRADKADEPLAKHFQSGAHMALKRAIEYVKDAQAGILTDHPQ